MNKHNIYSRRSNLIIGFHGCDQSTVEKVLCGKEHLKASMNDYDWLGNGIYFWENNEERARQFANEAKKRGANIENPAVLGAIIDLGHCMDLTDTKYLEELKEAYDMLYQSNKTAGIQMPQNSDIGKSQDKLMRRLDCAVIEYAHFINLKTEEQAYDSVKRVFWEGKSLYPKAGFSEKNHIQLCLRNPNCIKGFFLPRNIDDKYPNP